MVSIIVNVAILNNNGLQGTIRRRKKREARHGAYGNESLPENRPRMQADDEKADLLQCKINGLRS